MRQKGSNTSTHARSRLAIPTQPGVVLKSRRPFFMEPHASHDIPAACRCMRQHAVPAGCGGNWLTDCTDPRGHAVAHALEPTMMGETLPPRRSERTQPSGRPLGAETGRSSAKTIVPHATGPVAVIQRALASARLARSAAGSMRPTILRQWRASVASIFISEASAKALPVRS
jgi:hypothetical protein